jgi:hypothetical protein
MEWSHGEDISQIATLCKTQSAGTMPAFWPEARVFSGVYHHKILNREGFPEGGFAVNHKWRTAPVATETIPNHNI